MPKLAKIFFTTLLSALLLSNTASADPMLEGAQACTRHLPKAERYHNIPTHWLAAIASTESGRYHKRLGLTLPWPWTINVNGKGYYFDSKGDALDKIEEYHAKGITNIDVGCMQVNMRYHGHAFANIQQALEPRYNVAYAARFLRENYDEFRSWKQATAAYHSRTPSRGKNYFNIVFGKWEKVVEKLGGTVDTAALQVESNRHARKTLPKHSRFAVNDGQKKQQKVKMKVIKIADSIERPHKIAELEDYQKSYQNGVLVSRPPSYIESSDNRRF